PPPTTALYTLSLHDALPISASTGPEHPRDLEQQRGQVGYMLGHEAQHRDVERPIGQWQRPRQRMANEPRATAAQLRRSALEHRLDRKSTRLNSSHDQISYAV